MAKEKKKKDKKTPQEDGVNEFIKRLRKKGVDEGKVKAQEIISNAETEANAIIVKAQKKADRLLSKAKADSEKLESSAKDSVRTAFRDSVLELKTAIQNDFLKELNKIVKSELNDKKMIKKMILAIAENTSTKEKKEISIADPVKDGDKLKASVYSITKDMLKDGIELTNFASPNKSGMIIKEGKKGLELDLTDKAISDLLAGHLLPVYREMISGEK